MPAVEPRQRTDEWFAARAGKITASIAAACLGLDPYTSRQKAWRRILGTEIERTNKYMQWGADAEATALADYEVATGRLAEEVGFVIHPDHKWLGASPDGLIGTDGLLEIKCPVQLPERVPPHHRIQIAVQLICTGRSWCDYWAWTASRAFLARVWPLSRPAGLLERLWRFYESYVLTNTEPPRKQRRKKR